jgi:hypothetical protein
MEERLKSLEKHTNNMFIAGAIIGALSCFARADYNLPLYAFLYLLWDKDPVSIKAASYLKCTKSKVFLTFCNVEAQIPPHLPPRYHLGSRPAMDVLLGASLAKRRDEELAAGTPQLRNIRIVYQLGDEAGSNRDGVGDTENLHPTVDLGHKNQGGRCSCPRRLTFTYLVNN